MAAQADALGRYRRVRERRRPLGDPAGKLDVGLKASGVEARVEVAVLDRPTGVEAVSVAQTDAMASADPGRQLAQALRLFELLLTHPPAPAVSVARPAMAASAATSRRGE